MWGGHVSHALADTSRLAVSRPKLRVQTPFWPSSRPFPPGVSGLQRYCLVSESRLLALDCWANLRPACIVMLVPE
jgi:hypothetical protein